MGKQCFKWTTVGTTLQCRHTVLVNSLKLLNIMAVSDGFCELFMNEEYFLCDDEVTFVMVHRKCFFIIPPQGEIMFSLDRLDQ